MIALHTDSLHKYGLNRIFDFAKKAGYEGIEIGVDKNNYDTQNAQYIEALSRQYDIPVVALHSPVNGTSASVEYVVEMAVYLKCTMVVVSPPRFLDFTFTNWLRKQTPILRKKKNIQIALVNAPGRTLFGFLPDRALNSITDLKKFGMAALDCSAAVSKKWGDLMGTYNHLKKIIAHVHLSNVKHYKEYSLPNEGILPLESLLRKMKLDNFKGVISLRVRPSELSAGDDEKVVKKLQKAKEFIEEFFRK